MSGDNLDVGKWIRYALADHTAAVNMVLLHNPIPIEIVCYHCQQAAEKILKAYALAKNEPLIKTHDLVVLLNQCKGHSIEFDKYAKSCMALTTYASLSRYPSNVEITEQQMRQAMKDIQSIMSFVMPLFAEMGYVTKTQDVQKKSILERLEEAKEKAAEHNSSLPKKDSKKKNTEID
jgi:HEPN domain-containing protein